MQQKQQKTVQDDIVRPEKSIQDILCERFEHSLQQQLESLKNQYSSLESWPLFEQKILKTYNKIKRTEKGYLDATFLEGYDVPSSRVLREIIDVISGEIMYSSGQVDTKSLRQKKFDRITSILFKIKDEETKFNILTYFNCISSLLPETNDSTKLNAGRVRKIKKLISTLSSDEKKTSLRQLLMRRLQQSEIPMDEIMKMRLHIHNELTSQQIQKLRALKQQKIGTQFPFEVEAQGIVMTRDQFHKLPVYLKPKHTWIFDQNEEIYYLPLTSFRRYLDQLKQIPVSKQGGGRSTRSG